MEYRYIKNTNNMYMVSDKGYVFEAGNLKIPLKTYKNSSGAYLVSLKINDKFKTFLVHRLVAEEFLDNKFNQKQVKHIGSKDDNSVGNLYWFGEYYTKVKKSEAKYARVNEDLLILESFRKIDEIANKYYSYSPYAWKEINKCVTGKINRYKDEKYRKVYKGEVVPTKFDNENYFKYNAGIPIIELETGIVLRNRMEVEIYLNLPKKEVEIAIYKKLKINNKTYEFYNRNIHGFKITFIDIDNIY